VTEATLEKIRERATTAHSNSENWHFHILSPACTFNETERYAFILEVGPESALVYYSGKAEKELGAELSPLLHKPESTETKEQVITAEQQRVLDTAKRLNEHNAEWHHHVLFPGCMFNEQEKKYCLILEDPETKDKLEIVSDTEPRHVLKQLEPLFYYNT